MLIIDCKMLTALLLLLVTMSDGLTPMLNSGMSAQIDRIMQRFMYRYDVPGIGIVR